jgi:DNA-binding transcriptional LysR family regulator
MSRISLEALAALDCIDRRGSFAAAAAELHRSTSSVSHTVQKLEARLGVPLFDRGGHRAVLTPAGRALLEEGRGLLAAARALERRLQGLGQGWERELVIAVDDIVPLDRVLPLVGEFLALGAPTQVQLQQQVLGGVWEALVAQRADVALVDVPAVAPPDIEHWPLVDVPFVFAVAPGHPLLREKQPLSAAAWRAHRAIVVADSSRGTPLHPGAVSGLGTPPEVLGVSSLQAKLAAQRAGLGVGFLPLPWAAPALADGSLVAMAVRTPKPPARLSVAWRSQDAGEAVRWFVQRLQQPGALRA